MLWERLQLHEGAAINDLAAMLSFYHDNLNGQYPDLEEFRPGCYDYQLGQDAIWSCTPGAEQKTPEMDELYDRKTDPHQLQNIIKDAPETANDLFVQLRDFMVSLKAVN